MRTLITGATGFVGQALCAAASAQGWQVRAALRHDRSLPAGVDQLVVGDIGAHTDWTQALAGVGVVMHLAARVHVMRDTAADPLAAFRTVNLLGTENLARQAAHARVRRLVFLSSIKVNGESTPLGRPFTEDDASAPGDAYAMTKHEAEQALRALAEQTGIEVVILRPPLVYGPGVKANFLSLMRAVARGVPLPLGAIDNRRSLIYVGNLADAILRCGNHPAAAGQTYLVSDGEAVSTPELARRLAQTMGRPARVFPVPLGLLSLAGRLTGKAAQMARLMDSLHIDDGKIRRELDWRPLFSLDEGLRLTSRGLWEK